MQASEDSMAKVPLTTENRDIQFDMETETWITDPDLFRNKYKGCLAII